MVEYERIEGFDEETLAEMKQLVEICNAGSGPWTISRISEGLGPGVYVGSFWGAFEEKYLPSILITNLRRNFTLPSVFIKAEEAEDAAMEYVNQLLRESNG